MCARRARHVIAARVHPKRAEDRDADIVGIGHSRCIGDDAAEQRIAEVRIFEPALRRLCERDAGGQHLREIVLRQYLLAVAPRIVGDEPRDMVEQIAHADARTVRGRIGPALHFGHIVFGQIVEPQLALVAQVEHRQRGEGLGHRGDPEQRVAVDRRSGRHILDPAPLQIDELAILHDAIDEARNMLIGLIAGKERVDLGRDLVEALPRAFLRKRWRRTAEHHRDTNGRFPTHDDPFANGRAPQANSRPVRRQSAASGR